MLNREKDTFKIFNEAKIRNLSFLHIQSGLHKVTEEINGVFEYYKSDILSELPKTLHDTQLYRKISECKDAYDLIDQLEKEDLPHLVDNFSYFPFHEKIEALIPEELIDAEVIEEHLPSIKKAIHLIGDTPLYQDILVSSVSIFEVYLKDTLHDLIVNNDDIAKNFEHKVLAQLNMGEIPEQNKGTNQFIAHHIIQYSSFFNINTIEAHFQKCLYRSGKSAFKVHDNKKRRNEIKRYIRLRHLIVHQGGFVDQRYKSDVRCDYEIGERHPVLKRQVMEFIGYTEKIVDRIEKEIADY